MRRLSTATISSSKAASCTRTGKIFAAVGSGKSTILNTLAESHRAAQSDPQSVKRFASGMKTSTEHFFVEQMVLRKSIADTFIDLPLFTVNQDTLKDINIESHYGRCTRGKGKKVDRKHAANAETLM